MKFQFHEEARREYREAAGYYKKIRKELANEFVDEVERSIQRIRSTPESWLLVEGNIPRYLLRRFPYGIY
jgi:plasmid stabilization system protein ParE